MPDSGATHATLQGSISLYVPAVAQNTHLFVVSHYAHLSGPAAHVVIVMSDDYKTSHGFMKWNAILDNKPYFIFFYLKDHLLPLKTS